MGTDATVEKSCQLVDALHADLTLSKGLGSRHWAGAAISKNTKAIAVVVSQTSGTVPLFQNGEIVLRAEPFHHAMKWKDFEYEPPPSSEQACRVILPQKLSSVERIWTTLTTRIIG